MAGIYFVGHFLPRLSGNDRSQVISKASFCWVRFTLHYIFLTQKFTIFEVRTEPPCGYTFTAGPELIWPIIAALHSDDFSFFLFLFCLYGTWVRAFQTSVNIFQTLRNLLSGPGQPAVKSIAVKISLLLAALGQTADFSKSEKYRLKLKLL